MEIQNLIQEVERAEEDALTDLSDAIVACGYTGPIHRDRKKAINEASSLHSVMRLIQMLSQLREGLAIYGLDELLPQHHQALQPLFLPGNLKQVSTNSLGLCKKMSITKTYRKYTKEVDMINFLQDLLQNLEEGGNGCGVSGQAHVPLTDTEREFYKITVNFDHNSTTRQLTQAVCDGFDFSRH
uniref:Uncharacterized protein n=1 Tax=Nothobranchius furzeri TaxID=105023 RepID=A0A8C6NJ72_NOTFU